MNIPTALRLISSRAQSVSAQAARALLITSGPALQLRYDHIAVSALADDAAAWTPAERAQIVSLISGDEPTRTRTERVFLRLTPDERAAIEAAAAEAGVTLSEFIRSRALG